ncbi:hypothetical protein KY290_029427 [Solanum tuberosum]|uniref:Pentatricopeptide repeat-containing protein n=1 Tax=Solanum tuberosum TaxID=4113 RepID=A0ABQ7UKP8_SOLTU|nr:hypothetical protein KY290_029427 [Solanum tuberosum]
MSTFLTVHRLRRIFSENNRKSARKIIDVKTTEPTISSLNPTNHTPQGIVDFMKSSSICHDFRRRRFNYDIAVHRLAKAKYFSGIEEIIEHPKQYPDIRDDSFVGCFILPYGNAKMYDHARKLFDEMPQLDCQRTVYSFNVLLESCIRSERYDEIGLLFRELP